jgi:hypothetical protein
MLTITTSGIPEAEVRAALEASGRQIVSPEPEPAAAQDPNAASVPPSPAGESPVAAPDGESAAPSEGAEPGTQGEPPANQETQPQPPAEPPTRRANFEAKRVKLEKQIGHLQTELDLERGSKTELQKKLEAAEAELAKLKPAEATPAPVKDEGPVRPKRPTLESCEYDNERFERETEEYEGNLDAYYRALSRKEFEDARKAEDAKREADEKKAREDRAAEEYRGRLATEAKAIPDYDAVVEAVGDDVQLSDITHSYVLNSDHPARLIYHFLTQARDGVENSDLARIEAISNPFKRSIALRDLEMSLAGKSPAAAAAPVAAEPPKPAAHTVRQVSRPVRRVDEPITTVGSRTAANGVTLASATSAIEYARLRNQGVKN